MSVLTRRPTLYSNYTQLKQLTKYCLFYSIGKEIKSQIIQPCLSNKVRRKALCNSGIKFQQILDFETAIELNILNEVVTKTSMT